MQHDETSRTSDPCEWLPFFPRTPLHDSDKGSTVPSHDCYNLCYKLIAHVHQTRMTSVASPHVKAEHVRFPPNVTDVPMKCAPAKASPRQPPVRTERFQRKVAGSRFPQATTHASIFQRTCIHILNGVFLSRSVQNFHWFAQLVDFL